MQMHCNENENPIYVFPEMKLRSFLITTFFYLWSICIIPGSLMNVEIGKQNIIL